MRVLVTGATGFVGRRLVPRLVGEGHEVLAATRRPDEYDGEGEPVGLDLSDPDGDGRLAEVLATCDAAYYLVHSLDRSDYREHDRRLAERFATAADGIDRVVYLGGLGERGAGSEHLRSRHEVGDVLASRVPTVELSAAMLLGAGSASHELLRQLVRLLERATTGVAVAPRALATATQPVGADEAVTGLLAALALEPGRHHLGVDRSLTFAELMEAQSRATGGSLRVEPRLPIAPELFGPLATLVTDQDGFTILALFGSAGTPTVVDEARRLPGDVPVDVHEVLARVAAA